MVVPASLPKAASLMVESRKRELHRKKRMLYTPNALKMNMRREKAALRYRLDRIQNPVPTLAKLGGLEVRLQRHGCLGLTAGALTQS